MTTAPDCYINAIDKNVLDGRLIDEVWKDKKFFEITNGVDEAFPLIIKGESVWAYSTVGSKITSPLIPAFQRVLDLQGDSSYVKMLIICPTRKFAELILEECTQMFKNIPDLSILRHSANSDFNLVHASLLKHPPAILFGTPGLLLGHVSRLAEKKNDSGRTITNPLSQLQILACIEMDAMVDKGSAIRKIITHLPSIAHVPRQTVLFSKTNQPEVKELASAISCGNDLRLTSRFPDIANTTSGFELIEYTEYCMTVADDHPSTMIPTVLSLVRDVLAQSLPEFKAIIYLPTTWFVKFYALIFHKLSRKIERVKKLRILDTEYWVDDFENWATEFANNKNPTILFSTDSKAAKCVHANVTHVIQVNIPKDASQYFDRLPCSGQNVTCRHRVSYILLYPYEEVVFREAYTELEHGFIKKAPHPILSEKNKQEVTKIINNLPRHCRTPLYTAWLSYYQWFARVLSWNLIDFVKLANEFALETLQLDTLPDIDKDVVEKMKPEENGFRTVKKPKQTKKKVENRRKANESSKVT